MFTEIVLKNGDILVNDPGIGLNLGTVDEIRKAFKTQLGRYHLTYMSNNGMQVRTIFQEEVEEVRQTQKTIVTLSENFQVAISNGDYVQVFQRDIGIFEGTVVDISEKELRIDNAKCLGVVDKIIYDRLELEKVDSYEFEISELQSIVVLQISS